MDGYLLVKIDVELNAFELFWKGDIPAKVRSVIAAHPDVQVRIHHTSTQRSSTWIPHPARGE